MARLSVAIVVALAAGAGAANVTAVSAKGKGSSDSEGKDATELGHDSTASGDYALASGFGTKASGTASFSTGTDTGAIGTASFAGGMGSQAEGDYSTVFGYNTYATGEASLAVGHSCIASGMAASAFGHYTEAMGAGSLAVGHVAKAYARGSIAGGWNTKAVGEESLAFGSYATAEYDYSAAFGYGVSTSEENEVAVGYLKADDGISSPSYAISADSRLAARVGEDATADEPLAPREALVSLVRALRPKAVTTTKAWYTAPGEALEDASRATTETTTTRPAILVGDDDLDALDGARFSASADADGTAADARWSVLSRAPGFARTPHAYAEDVATSPANDGATCRVAIKMASGTPHGLEQGHTVRLQLEATGASPLFAKGDKRGGESAALDGSGVEQDASAAPREVPADAVVHTVVSETEFMAEIDEPCAAGLTRALVVGPWIEDLRYVDVGAVTAALVGSTQELLDARDDAAKEHASLRDELSELRTQLAELNAALGISPEDEETTTELAAQAASATAAAPSAVTALSGSAVVALAVGAALVVRRRMRQTPSGYVPVPSAA